MSYNIKNLEKDVLKSTFLEKVNKVLLTINDGINNDPFTRLTESQITMEERIYFAKNFKTDNSIYDYLKSSVILNKYIRVIYLNDKDVNTDISIIQSLIYNDADNEYTKVTTYFVTLEAKKNEILTKRLVAKLINMYIYALAGNELDSGYPRDISNKLMRIDSTIISFKAIDIIVDLKYSDFDDLVLTANLYDPHIHYDDIFTNKYEALRAIYNYAIEIKHTADDYEDLIVKVFDLG